MVTGLGLDDVARRLVDINSLLVSGPAPGTVTIGLAQLGPNDTADDLIDRADAAFYRRAVTPPSAILLSEGWPALASQGVV